MSLRFDMPFDEKFDTFLSRLGSVERTEMRYSLVDREGQKESTERLLTGNLFYHAMISELVKRPSTWDHAVVWQVGPRFPHWTVDKAAVLQTGEQGYAA